MKENGRIGWYGPDTATQAKIRDQVYKDYTAVNWEPHPLNEKVKLAYILTQRKDHVAVTCLLARVPRGEEIPEHTHYVHDIIFTLSGRGKIWIKGLGALELRNGVLVSVPPNVPHRVYDVTEDMEIYDVFSGAIE